MDILLESMNLSSSKQINNNNKSNHINIPNDNESSVNIYNELLDSFPKILSKILESLNSKTLNSSSYSAEIIDRTKFVLQENVPHGKLNRGVTFLIFYRGLKKERTKESDFESYMLAWVLEILQSASLVADDMMDNSVTRRGSLCWYKRPEVGMIAINDVLLLENIAYQILHWYFGKKEYYSEIVQLLQDILFKTIIGQQMDLQLSKCTNRKGSNFLNFETYSNMVLYKTTYYTFHLPVKFAILAAGLVVDENTIGKIDNILNEIGVYFQAQDDIIDCYGDPGITGKIGTDISDGKCTWLLVKALEICSEEEVGIISDFYGIPSKAKTILDLYDKLGILNIHKKFEEQAYIKLLAEIEDLPAHIPKDGFKRVLDNIHRRNK